MTVPARTGSGRISVTTPAGKAVSSGDFIVPPAGYTAGDIEFTGRMAIGESKVVTVTTANKIAMILFDGAQGQQVSLKLSNVTIGSSSVFIFNPDGTTLASSTFVSTGGSFVDTKTLPATGTYTILIDPDYTYTGMMTLTLYDVVDVTGSIIPGGPLATVTTNTPGQNARLTFNGSAGQRVSLGLTSLIPSSIVSIYSPDGTTLTSKGLGTGAAFIDTVTLPTSGIYTILVDPQGANTGSMTLALYNVPHHVSGITIDGPSVTVAITTPGQNASLTFGGTLSQTLGLGLTGVTTPYPTYVNVYKPDGTLLTSTGVGTGGSSLDLPPLTASGTYTLVVDPQATNIGNMTLTLSSDLTGTITIDGPLVMVNIPRPGQNARLAFSGALSQTLGLGLTHVTISPPTWVYVYKPDGTTLASYHTTIGSSGFGLPRLPASGMYTILVSPNSAYTGTMSLILSQDVTGTIAIDGPPVTVNIPRQGQRAWLTFSGTQSQTLGLGMTDVTIPRSSVVVYKPDGTFLTFVTVFASGAGLDLPPLPMSGMYTILVDTLPINPPGVYTGTMTLTLSQDVTGTITIDGPPVTVNIPRPGQKARLIFSGTQSQTLGLGLTDVTIVQSGLNVYKPDGAILAYLGLGVGIGGAGLDFPPLPVAGTYTILVNPDSVYTDTMTLALSSDVTGTITIDGPGVAVNIARPGQNARLTFDGTLSQTLTLSMTNVTITQSNVAVYKPNGTGLASTNVGTGGGILNLPLLPASGTYTILINPSGIYTGSMTLTLVQTASANASAETPPTPDTNLIGNDLGNADIPGMDLRTGAPLTVDLRADDEKAATASEPDTANTQAPGESHTALQAEPNVTALVGQVLKLNGQPLANVTLQIDDESALTDNTGRFLLSSITPGHHELLIDGRTAGTPGTTYGVFEVGVDVIEGETNELPYTIWMPKIDTAHAVTIPSPTTAEVVVTTPHIQGLAVHIPPGTVITDTDGQVVTQISITPIPVARPPFPLPRGVEVPIYFTIQPGGAYVSPDGVRIIYPNYTHEAPGTRINFWHYDPEVKGWYIYGQGTVTEDGQQVVPDPGVAVYEFTGAMINVPGYTPPPNGCPPGGCICDGDPVELCTGLFVLNQTDLVLPGVPPIALTRTYRPGDNQSRPFGIGATHQYELFLWSAQQFEEADLILPDGGRVHYVRISPSAHFTEVVFEHTSTPSMFYKSRFKWNGRGWDLTLKDGTVYVFGEGAPLQSIRDRFGNRITLTRTNDQSGNIAQVRSSDGRWIEFTYDASNRVTQAKDNIGRVVSYTYDASGRLWKVTDPNGGVTEYTYDASHRMLTIKNARGIVFLTNQYDTAGRVVNQTHADGGTYQFAYTVDANGKITQTDVTDPRGSVRRVTFNADGYSLTDTRALGKPEQQTITYERQAGTNLILNLTDPLGRRTAYAYDAMGNATSIARLAGTPGAVTTTLTYEPRFNQVTSIADPLNHTTTSAYDDKGNPIRKTDPLGNRTTFAYNEAGQPISVTDPLSSTTQFAYDLGDLVAVTDPLGHTSTQFTDSAGRLGSVTNPRGHTTRYAYDALNRLIRMTDPLGGVTAFFYDLNGNLLSVTDARGHSTSYTYDNMDRLASRTDPLSRVESYQYDAAGNLTRFIDRKGQITRYEYDALNRLVRTTYADGSTTNYTYDAGDRPTQVVDSTSGTIARTYDNLDRLISETTPQGTVSYTYDASGRRTSMTVAGQPAVNYTYDNADRLTQITQGASTVTMVYDDADRRTALTLPNGVVVQYAYDAASQLTGITYKKGTTVLGNLAYEYDAAGQRTGIRGTYARSGIPQPVISATYDAANQLTQWDTTPLTYDANGNVANDGANTYGWDARNQLAFIQPGTGPTPPPTPVPLPGPERVYLPLVQKGGTITSFQYDALGRRIKKTINGVSTGYLYDDLNPVQELSGGTPTANLLTGLEVDEYFVRTDVAGSRAFLADALGSTMALLDSVGNVQTQYTYEPFGKTTATGLSSANSFQYTARENDWMGLYYYRARYYDPKIGRFISEDPIGFEGGLDLYTYVLNNPVNLTDSFGLAPSPPGRPWNPPKPGFWHRFFFGTPRTVNPCRDGCEPVSYDTGPNLHTDYGAWQKWRDKFRQDCEAMGQGYEASCPPEGINQPHGTRHFWGVQGHGQITVCWCCKCKCKQ